MPRKPSLDGKDSSLRIRMTAEDKERLVSYAERHYQTMSGVICQALIFFMHRRKQKIAQVDWSFFGVYFSFSGTETTKNKHKFELKLSIQAS